MEVREANLNGIGLATGQFLKSAYFPSLRGAAGDEAI